MVRTEMAERRSAEVDVADSYRGAAAKIMARSAILQGAIADQMAGDAAAALGLRRVAALADALGRPQETLRIVHVAGTKGKGSTVAFLSAMLVAAGHRTGRYTSPHLAKLTERIAIDGADLDDETFAHVANRVLTGAEHIERERPELGRVNALEILFVMALVAFREANCRVAVIEVGIGGRLDTTNILDPVVSVITTLDLEHTAILGDTLAEIASEKAGIIKPGRPVVAAPQPDEALVVIRAQADAVGSRLIVVGTLEDSLDDLELGLFGPHQALNARLAIAALVELAGTDAELLVDPDQRRAGLQRAWLPGRFEVVPARVVRAAFNVPRDRQVTVVLDGAHTSRAAAALRLALDAAYPSPSGPIAVCGFTSDKDVSAFLDALRPAMILPVMATSPRAVQVDQIAVIARELGIVVCEGATATAEALRWLAQSVDDTDLVVVTGSFMVVAEARAALGLDGRRA